MSLCIFQKCHRCKNWAIVLCGCGQGNVILFVCADRFPLKTTEKLKQIGKIKLKPQNPHQIIYNKFAHWTNFFIHVYNIHTELYFMHFCLYNLAKKEFIFIYTTRLFSALLKLIIFYRNYMILMLVCCIFCLF